MKDTTSNLKTPAIIKITYKFNGLLATLTIIEKSLSTFGDKKNVE